MKRALVHYRCGAETVVLYPEDAPGALEQLRKTLAVRDCEYCTGEREDGWATQLTDGHLDLWRRRPMAARTRG